MDATKTNRDMLYRAFGLLTAEDATLLASALRNAADTRFVLGTQQAGLRTLPEGPGAPTGERGRLYEMADIASAVAADLRSGRP